MSDKGLITAVIIQLVPSSGKAQNLQTGYGRKHMQVLIRNQWLSHDAQGQDWVVKATEITVRVGFCVSTPVYKRAYLHAFH
jgi:hypothetical protein